ncbi:phosphate ABC transporter substrate-binding protein, PhoT family [Desulforamulus reducens MI-1]|uniref:Phosphate-binding protein n=1 Tax=Desulforamulus reducens (strain ATCC BAA-1160 / DSM 100696 / MI-1) TaxID=349161 RepID=A4J6C0_DESRM|nr:phosphate ABC transporter substrate-binding protein [Desulforamulus reducens]ABO50623.1 phosphate ABC transporter substrate-binding protein, PhoT family [Desulforamulus reducens MI-1]
MFKNTKKLMLVLTLILAATVVFAGCGKKEEAPKAEGEKGAGLSGSITIAGSTSVQPLSEELAKAFMTKNSGVTVNVQGGGSSAGVKAANEGAAQIGASSRDLKESEKGMGLTETKIALDGIAVVVNPKNQVADLTMEQVAKIFSGEIKNWKEVGGKDAAINVVTREEGSGTRGAFEEIVLGEAKMDSKAITQPSTGSVKTTVAGDENAIGYISLGSLNEEVKGVKVDGVKPTVDNVKAGAFKISRPFLYLTKGEMNEVTKAYVDFVMSEEGQKIVGESHFISIK